MTKAEKEQALARFHQRLEEEKAKGSTGSLGKHLDFIVRCYLNGDPRKEADVRCRAAGKVDWKVKVNGHYLKGETKHAEGSWKGNGTEAEDIFPGYDFVAYTAENEGITEENFMHEVRVFTRVQFIEMLEYTGKKGLQSSVVRKSREGVIGIQHWSAKRMERWYDFIDSHNDIPTLAEFKASLKR